MAHAAYGSAWEGGGMRAVAREEKRVRWHGRRNEGGGTGGEMRVAAQEAANRGTAVR